MERIAFREIIELFLNTTIHEIKSESEVPNVNFKFQEDGIQLFKNIVKNHLSKMVFGHQMLNQKI